MSAACRRSSGVSEHSIVDLETIMRLHIAQKTDFWFNDDVDQAALWGASEYIPDNCIVAHLNNLDEYSFRSAMASSLCLGWIADAPDFDFKTGKLIEHVAPHRVGRLVGRRDLARLHCGLKQLPAFAAARAVTAGAPRHD